MFIYVEIKRRRSKKKEKRRKKWGGLRQSEVLTTSQGQQIFLQMELRFQPGSVAPDITL